jgi:hypothetical protein
MPGDVKLYWFPQQQKSRPYWAAPEIDMAKIKNYLISI